MNIQKNKRPSLHPDFVEKIERLSGTQAEASFVLGLKRERMLHGDIDEIVIVLSPTGSTGAHQYHSRRGRSPNQLETWQIPEGKALEIGNVLESLGAWNLEDVYTGSKDGGCYTIVLASKDKVHRVELHNPHLQRPESDIHLKLIDYIFSLSPLKDPREEWLKNLPE